VECHSEMGTCFVIIDEGYSPSWVPSPLQWTIMQLLEYNMIEWKLAREIKEGDSTIIDIDFKRWMVSWLWMVWHELFQIQPLNHY
jgi:hypothetical protein